MDEDDEKLNYIGRNEKMSKMEGSFIDSFDCFIGIDSK